MVAERTGKAAKEVTAQDVRGTDVIGGNGNVSKVEG